MSCLVQNVHTIFTRPCFGSCTVKSLYFNLGTRNTQGQAVSWSLWLCSVCLIDDMGVALIDHMGFKADEFPPDP